MWAPGDREKALAWMMNKAKRHHCGMYTDDFLTDGGEREAEPPYEVGVASCPACEDLAIERMRLDKESEKDGAKPREMYSLVWQPYGTNAAFEAARLGPDHVPEVP